MASKKSKFALKAKKKLLFFVIAVSVILLLIGYAIFQNLPIKYSSLTFYPVTISSLSKGNVLFSDKNVVYKALLNGSRPQKIASVSRIVTAIIPLTNGNILIKGDGRYVDANGNFPSNLDYQTEGARVYEKTWIVKKDEFTAKAISEKDYEELSLQTVFNTKKYYPLPVSSGGVDIMFQESGVKPAIKVGHLANKIHTISPCEAPAYKAYPTDFISSLNGDYLISHAGGGGGTCKSTEAIISSDGLVVFDVNPYRQDFAWIGNNQLLVNNTSNSKSEVLSFNKNGTFNTKVLNVDLTKYNFNQEDISPSKKLLFLHSKNSAIYDIEKNTINPIQVKYLFSSWLSTLGDFLLFSYYPNKTQDDQSKNTISIYDSLTGMNYKLAEPITGDIDYASILVVW